MKGRAKHKGKNPAIYAAVPALLVLVVFAALLFTRPGEESVQFSAAEEEPCLENVSVSPELPPEAGSLVQSGKGLNENYYGMFHFSGMIDELSDISFVMGGEHPATDLRTGKDRPGSLTVYYGDETIVKTALLYYGEDRFEIYMGSMEDIKAGSEYMYEVVLKDPDASALWATEIVVSRFVF